MPSFILRSYKDGISDYEDKGLPGAFKFGTNLDPRRRIDSIKAQQALTDDLATGTMTSPPRFAVNSADGNTYISSGLEIYKRTSAGVYSLVYTDVGSDGNITGMAEWVNDNGDTFIYWATATKLHRKAVLTGTTPVNTDWSDVDATVNGQSYPKTNLTSATWHTMKIVNGALIIVNADTLAKVGYDDSYTTSAVKLYPGNVGKTLIESGILAKVGTNRVDSGDNSTLIVWDTDDQNFTDKLTLPFANINAMIETEVGIIQYGTDGQIYFFGDNSKVPITAFPGGGQVDPDGVALHEGLALMGVYGNGTGKTGIYTYGRKTKNANFILNCEWQFECDAIYSVFKVGTDIFFTYLANSAYGVKRVDTTNKASTATYESLDLKAPPEYGRIPVWSTVVLPMTSLPTSTSVEVWRKVDKGDTWVQCNVQGGATSFSTATGRQATFLIGDKARILELRIILNCSGNSSPEILPGVQVFFD